jgi:hypothetical protein
MRYPPEDDATRLRLRQEREIEASYAVADMEHALAQEAALASALMRDAGVSLDLASYVGVRLLDALVHERGDAGELRALVAQGIVERTVAAAAAMIAQPPASSQDNEPATSG